MENSTTSVEGSKRSRQGSNKTKFNSPSTNSPCVKEPAEARNSDVFCGPRDVCWGANSTHKEIQRTSLGLFVVEKNKNHNTDGYLLLISIG